MQLLPSLEETGADPTWVQSTIATRHDTTLFLPPSLHTDFKANSIGAFHLNWLWSTGEQLVASLLKPTALVHSILTGCGLQGDSLVASLLKPTALVHSILTGCGLQGDSLVASLLKPTALVHSILTGCGLQGDSLVASLLKPTALVHSILTGCGLQGDS